MTEVNVAFGDLNLANKEKFIIDCDAGSDDALAILLALNTKLGEDIDVLGITCVGGNTTVDMVVENVLRTLKVAHREHVPVYRGANTGVISRDLTRKSNVFSGDGLGGAARTVPVTAAQVDDVSQRPNAVNWLGETITKFPPGSITLVALGPMTNVAFALRLYPDIHSRLKRMVVMGGTLDAHGNSNLSAEFNFWCDPEAADAVLGEFTCPITIMPFSVTVDHYFPFDWYNHTISASNSTKANFVRSIFQMKIGFAKTTEWKYGGKGFYACDWLAMACAMQIPGVVLETVHHYCTVELDGKWTRGQFVVDWRDAEGDKRKMEIVTKMDIEKLKSVFQQTLL